MEHKGTSRWLILLGATSAVFPFCFSTGSYISEAYWHFITRRNAVNMVLTSTSSHYFPEAFILSLLAIVKA